MKYVQFGNVTIEPSAENLTISISYEFLFKFFFLIIFWGRKGCLLEKSNGVQIRFSFSVFTFNGVTFASKIALWFVLLSLGNTCPKEPLFNEKVWFFFNIFMVVNVNKYDILIKYILSWPYKQFITPLQGSFPRRQSNNISRK